MKTVVELLNYYAQFPGDMLLSDIPTPDTDEQDTEPAAPPNE